LSYETDKSSLAKLKNRFTEIYNTLDKNGDQKLSFEEFTKSLGLSDNNFLFIEQLEQF